jgi:putative ribosome biogenesis GTPase RsgA
MDRFNLLEGEQLTRTREILTRFQAPRYTTTERDALHNPQIGQIIYNTSTSKLNVYTGSWEAITST